MLPQTNKPIKPGYGVDESLSAAYLRGLERYFSLKGEKPLCLSPGCFLVKRSNLRGFLFSYSANSSFPEFKFLRSLVFSPSSLTNESEFRNPIYPLLIAAIIPWNAKQACKCSWLESSVLRMLTRKGNGELSTIITSTDSGNPPA